MSGEKTTIPNCHPHNFSADYTSPHTRKPVRCARVRSARAKFPGSEMVWRAAVSLLLVLAMTVAQGEDIALSLARGISCPYTGSWLAHVNLVLDTLWVPSLKMEEASFSVLRRAKQIFQVVDEELYFVNHLSGYEHEVMRRSAGNFSDTEERALRLSREALAKECSSVASSLPLNSTLSVIPFFSGRPPEVSEDLQVHSIGQGNSLVSPITKAMQCISTVCSTLRYFGTAIIAVTSSDDRALLQSVVSGSTARPHSSFLSDSKIRPTAVASS